MKILKVLDPTLILEELFALNLLSAEKQPANATLIGTEEATGGLL